MEIPETGLLDKIRPPRLEDAGLEDCALPPDSIKEAFEKAAAAVRSIVSPSPDDEAGGHCVNDPWASALDSSDVFVGISEGAEDIPEGSAAKKGVSMPSVEGDDVVIEGYSEENEKVDEVVVGGESMPEKEQACVDGLQGLEIGDKGKKLKDGDAGNDDKVDDEKPSLTYGFV